MTRCRLKLAFGFPACDRDGPACTGGEPEGQGMATDYADILVAQIAALCATAIAPRSGEAVSGVR